MSCAVIRTRLPARRIEPSSTDCTPSSRPMVRTSTERPLYAKLELRAITVRPAIFDKSVMMSSLIPSEKYSCSGSPDMLVKGKTAIDTAGVGCGVAALDRTAAGIVAPGCHFQTRIGRSIFLTLISPPSWKNVNPIADAFVDDRRDTDATGF